jgi:hypothetical protein
MEQFEEDKLLLKDFFSKLEVRPCAIIDLWKGILYLLILFNCY